MKTDRAQNPAVYWCRFPTRVVLQFRVGSMMFSFSMYPAVYTYFVHWCCLFLKDTLVHFTLCFPRSVRPSILDSVVWASFCLLLVSVSYIGICVCVGLFYRSFISACVRYLYRFCVSGAEHGSAYTGSSSKVWGSFAGDAVCSEVVVGTSAVTYIRCTE